MRQSASLVLMASLLGLLPLVNAQLAILAKLAGKQYFGTAVDNRSLGDELYVKKTSNRLEFDQLTPSNTMKWETIQPERGVFDFSGAEAIVNLAKKNRQLIRGHTCAWHSQLAPWVEAGKFNKRDLLKIVEDHCYTLVRHFKGDVITWLTTNPTNPVQWDVVNEPFNEDGTFRESVFYNTTGLDFIRTSLRAARKADPKAKLYINDYNLEGLSPKSTGAANLIKQLKREGVPIDGIGAQGHLIVGQVPTTIRENLQAFADLGVDVAITELDIRMELPVTPEKLEQQKKDYKYVIESCKAVKRCVGVTIWDWTDKYSWVPGWFEGEGAPLPWDENFDKKPAYYGIVEGWLKWIR